MGTVGFSLLLKVPLYPFEMPRTVLVDTETGEGSNFCQIEHGLTRNVTSQRQKTVYLGLRYPGLVLLWADASSNQAIGW